MSKELDIKKVNHDIIDNYMAFRNDNTKSSEVLKYVNGKIAVLEDDLQHYTMVEKDKCKEFFIREDLKQFTNIKQALIKAQEQEEENIKLKGQVAYLTEVATDFQNALKIIFEKYVDVDFLKSADNFEEYNRLIKFKVFLPLELTEEEFNLVKRYTNE